MKRNYYGLALKLVPNLLIGAGVAMNVAITVATHKTIMDYYNGKIVSPNVRY